MNNREPIGNDAGAELAKAIINDHVVQAESSTSFHRSVDEQATERERRYQAEKDRAAREAGMTRRVTLADACRTASVGGVPIATRGKVGRKLLRAAVRELEKRRRR